jgi:hypothetical protein
MLRTVLACLALSLAVSLATPAFAAFPCDEFWGERNAIYKDAGYCFQTPRAIRAFGNADCKYDNITDVPLSARNRSDIGEITRQERANNCPR